MTTLQPHIQISNVLIFNLFFHSTVRDIPDISELFNVDIPDMSELFNVLIFQMATIYISQPLSLNT